ncbi:hypothetical protein Tco_0122747 [Tanacetum coccineum]
MEWISLTLSITNRCIRLKLDEDIMGFLQLTNYGFRREWCSLMYLTAVDPTCMRTLLAGHKRSKASTAIINLEAEYNAHRLDVLLLFAVTMSRTLALNTSTYGTISSKSKWKIEWLNSTSWKRIIKTAGHSQQALPETVRILLPRLGMKSLTPETLRDVFKKERMSKHNVFVELPNGGLIHSELPNGGLIHSELPNGGLIHSELPNGGLIHSGLPKGGSDPQRSL